MTVLIGALCRDGIVIGSDSSVTFAAGQMRTIEVPGHQKVFVSRNGNALWSGTGAVGMGQRFSEVVAAVCDPKFLKATPGVNVAQAVCQETIKNFRSTDAPRSSFGALLAFEAAGSLTLCEFDIDHFQPEVKTETSWFVSLGSGQPLADGFLAFLSRTLFDRKQPTLDEGLLMVLWTLRHVIDCNVGGISGPEQLGVLRSTGSRAVPELLTEDELQEHRVNVEAAENHVRNYKQAFSGSEAQPIQPPPPGS